MGHYAGPKVRQRMRACSRALRETEAHIAAVTGGMMMRHAFDVHGAQKQEHECN